MKKFIILLSVVIFLAFATNAFAQVKEEYTRIMFEAFSLVYKDTDKATRIKLDELRVLLKELSTMAVNIERYDGSSIEITSIAKVHACNNADGKACDGGETSIMEEGFKFDTTPEPKATPTPKP